MVSIALRNEARFRLLKDHSRMNGQGVSADEASLALRGLETMAVRLERIERTTLSLLDFMIAQPGVREVRHPALTHNPGHAEWLRDFSGSTGLLTLFLEPGTSPQLSQAIAAMRAEERCLGKTSV